MSGTGTPTARWMSQARFDREYGTAGFDHDFGMQWGPQSNQRISLRLAADASHGVLHVYDPIWNEYNILDSAVTQAEASRALAHVVSWFGDQGVGVDAFVESMKRARLVVFNRAPVEPTTEREMGLEL